jgi:hypothetical protein
MVKTPDFDVTAAHRFFAADCFNRAWDLIDKPDRTPEEDRLMVALNQASIFHWLQRPDVSDKTMSVGYWQASRIQSLLGHPHEAGRHAQACLDLSQRLEPFYLAYAYEAQARAAVGEGDAAGAGRYLEQAEKLAAKVSKEADRELVLADLGALRGLLAARP